ncbi:unnamed protein product [Blepharisma stoltei]|uniref:Uncharacterized protein n=1 Tax=Blepharisma stoltei TaxID=1481888 RepID=A0AAU9K5H5_9CILI|nr:unnamed protein product [Blepharisma stoltei]
MKSPIPDLEKSAKSPKSKDLTKQNFKSTSFKNILEVSSSLPSLNIKDLTRSSVNSPIPPQIITDRPYSQLAFRDILNPSKKQKYKRQESLKKQMETLDKMGFRSHFDKHSSLIRGFGASEKKFTMPNSCMTDLWGESKEEAFLKINGLWDAYIGIKKKHDIDIIKNDKSISKPNKPYIMDINAMRQSIFTEQKNHENRLNIMMSPSRLTLRRKSFSTQNAGTKLSKIKEIIQKCDELFIDNKTFKSNTANVIEGLGKDYQVLDGITKGKRFAKKKRRLTEVEMRQIKRDMNGLSIKGTF